MSKAAAQPLLHFLLLGGLLFASQQFAVERGWLVSERESIRLNADDVARLRANWIRETGREPGAAELQASLRRHVDEELLLREALRAGLDGRDPVVRERLLLNMRFAFPQSRDDDEKRLRDARALGMITRDVVARRRLVQVMQRRIVGEVTPTERQIREYVSRHPERYSRPVRYGFRHVFFSSDQHGTSTWHEAETTLANLRSQSGSAASAGDPFLLGNHFASQTADEIARNFGWALAQQLTQVSLNAWAGPVASPYGVHLLRLEHIEAAVPLPFAQIRLQAAYAMQNELEQKVLQRELGRLRGRYDIRIADITVQTADPLSLSAVMP